MNFVSQILEYFVNVLCVDFLYSLLEILWSKALSQLKTSSIGKSVESRYTSYKTLLWKCDPMHSPNLKLHVSHWKKKCYLTYLWCTATKHDRCKKPAIGTQQPIGMQPVMGLQQPMMYGKQPAMRNMIQDQDSFGALWD